MRLLLVHADFIEFEAKKKAIASAEKIEKKKHRIEECLVVFASSEKGDDSSIVNNVVGEIEGVAKQVNTARIVVYPFVHLSAEPASPSVALDIVKKIGELLKQKKYDVYRAPFGWYKSFDIRCKGHPLSELSRVVTKEKKKKAEDIPEALKKEDTLKSEWFIFDGDKKHRINMKGGKIDGFDFSKYPKLEKLSLYEMKKSRLVVKEPPHISLMRSLELVDYEGGSDPGHFRFLPKGKLIKSLLEDWVTQQTTAYGALEVETPIMYDRHHPSLESYLNRFPARQYNIQTPNKEVFLRFSACFGQFLIAKDTNISYRNLPLPVYELTRYSFRVEQRGELAGLRRLRAFTMPDCHAIVKDFEQAKEQMMERFDLSKRIMNGIGLTSDDFAFSIRVVKDIYEKHKDFFHELVKKFEQPVLVEIWDKKFFYFVLKHEWNFVDSLDKAACLTTDQLDVENAQRYGIKYMDSDNEKKYPLILHLSPSGSIERVMYALLEKAYMQRQEGENPVFKLWLSPTQIRLCPINDTFNKWAQEIADKLEKEKIRVDIDDRTESINRKVRDAETEWINLIVVLGEKEKKSGSLAVRFRETGKVKNMKPKELSDFVKKETGQFPFRKLPLPRLLSKRPVFIG